MKKTLERESRNAVIGTVIIVIAMVLVFGAVFAWMYSVDLLFLPDFMEDMLGLNEDNDVTWDLGALSEIVKSGKDEKGESVIFEATYDNLREAFLGDQAPQSFVVTAEISYYSDGEPSVRSVKYYKNEEKFRIEAYALNETRSIESLKIGDGERLIIVDPKTDISRSIPMGDDISPEDEAGIPSVSELLSIVRSFPKTTSKAETEASEGQLMPDTPPVPTLEISPYSDCEIKLIRRTEGNVYYIAFTYRDEAVRHEYYVSLSHNSVISHTVYAGDAPMYSYKVVRFSVDSRDYRSASLYTVEND